MYEMMENIGSKVCRESIRFGVIKICFSFNIRIEAVE